MEKRTVYLGLSGGVDSAVAGALLLEQGFHVVPVFLKCWEPATLATTDTVVAECPWREDQEAALAVAEHLGIADRFRSWNFTEEFFETVVQYLVDDAAAGRTGNPDVVCNRSIKFGAFLKRALQEGAEYVATGHYARISPAPERDREIPRLAERSESGLLYDLQRARCAPKNDQTYFLWQLSQEQLRYVLFPLGEFGTKDDVREEARRRGLPSAERRSTRGICFVSPKEGYAAFLKQMLPVRPGAVVTTSGRVVGQHDGLAFYTLGQRQGIGVTADGGPYYVVEKDEEANILRVAPPADAHRLWQDEVVVGEVNWLAGTQPELPLRCEAFVRHPQDRTVACTVTQRDTNVKTHTRKFVRVHSFSDLRLSVKFREPQYALTPGQSVVFYAGDTVLGGGVIQEARTM